MATPDRSGGLRRNGEGIALEGKQQPRRIGRHRSSEANDTTQKLDLLDANRLYSLAAPKEGIPRFKTVPKRRAAISRTLITDIPPINSQAQERLGYPTQKPEALLERIIKASSNEGDLVLDPFCGCGTTVQVAQRLNRRWIGIDITHLAIGLIKKRLSDAFGPEIQEHL